MQITKFNKKIKLPLIQKYTLGIQDRFLRAIVSIISKESLTPAMTSNCVSQNNEEDFGFSGFNFDQEEYPRMGNNMSQIYSETQSIMPPTHQNKKRSRVLSFNSLDNIAQSKVRTNEPYIDVEAKSSNNQSFEERRTKLSHQFEEDALSNEYSIHSQSIQKNKNNNDQDQLSDYNNSSDQQVSQYHNSLFEGLKNKNNAKPKDSRAVEKINSSNQIELSDGIKQSQRTNDMIAKRSQPKKQLHNRFKEQKKEKVRQTQSANSCKYGQTRERRWKAENKRRFTKKQLQLVSRKFQQFYAYETNRQFKGQKVTLRQISQAFQLEHAAVHRLYVDWMDDPYFYERIKKYDQAKRQTKHPERKLTLQRLQHVTKLIHQNPFLTQHQLCVQLNKIEDLKVIKCGLPQNMTSTIVSKLLKMGKFKKKRVKCMPKQKNTSKSLQKRLQYCTKYKEILERRAKVYFLDESGFNLYMTRDKAWSRPNEQVTVNCPISKGKRFSLIAIIGDDGLAHWRFIEGNYRKFEYLDFIRQLFQKLVEHQSPEDPEEKWIVMDNCAIHDKEQTINLAKQYNINVLYLPSYSPQLNPIQNWFHEIKVKLKKINYSGQKQLFNIMERILKEYQEHDFSNYYHGSLKFVEKGLKKEKF